MDINALKKANEKAVFMKLIMSIKGAHKESIKLLSKTSISNARVLERNSKSIKDPDPLSSALANNSLKWPITVNVDRLRNAGDYSKEDLASWDSRKHRRKVCSFRMVDHWLAKDCTISQTDKETITKMFDHKKERLNQIKGIAWDNISFKMAEVNLERMAITTNPGYVEIPRDLRDEAIAQVICGESMIEYKQVPFEYKEKIKDLIAEYHFEHASIPNLVNFLKSQLDPKIRTLPMISGMKPFFIDVSHVLIQPRYRAMELSKFVGVEKGTCTLMTSVAMAVLQKRQTERMETVKKDMDRIFISNVPASHLINETQENIYIKSCKALMGLPIKPEIDLPSLKMSPMPSKVIPEELTHGFSGLTYIQYVGDETITFWHKHTNGSFTHNGPHLYSVTMQKTAVHIIKMIIGRISCFIKSNIEKCHYKSMKALKDQMYIMASTRPWEYIFATEKEWQRGISLMKKAGYEGEVQIGKMKLVNTFDYKAAPETIVKMEKDTGSSATGQQILTVPRIRGEVFWPDTITTSSSVFFRHLHPSIALTKSILHIMYWKDNYLRLAEQHKWEPPHPFLLRYVEPGQVCAVRETAKARIIEMFQLRATNDILLFSLLYSFAYPGPPSPDRIIKFTYNAKDTISFKMDEGKVLRNPTSKEGTVYGSQMQGSGLSSDIGFMYNGIVENIKFSTRYNPSINRGPPINLSELSLIAPKMKRGEERLVRLQETTVLATRSLDISLDTFNTIERATTREFRWKHASSDVAEMMKISKRKREDDDERQDPTKKPHIATSSIAIYASLSSGSS